MSYIAQPKELTTLILSYKWLPINVTTARESIRKMTVGVNREKPDIFSIGPHGEMLDWNDWVNEEVARYYENQPHMRSAHQIFPVPTILLTTSNWGFKVNRKVPSLRYLYNRLKKKCQICGEKYPIKMMTLEHIIPKSKGGAHDASNVTMTCKECNSRKGNLFPYLNYEGKKLTAPKVIPNFHTYANARKEWTPYTFTQKAP